MTQPNQSELEQEIFSLTVLTGQKFMKTRVLEDWTLAKQIMELVTAYITANYTPNSEAADKVKTAVATRELELDHHWSKELERAVLRGKIEELRDIAPDMRTHPEYKGYVETSAGGRWKPLSKRIKSLEAELKKLEDK